MRRVDSACYGIVSVQPVALPVRTCGYICLSDNWLSRPDICEKVCSEDSADSRASALTSGPHALTFPQKLPGRTGNNENGGFSCRVCHRRLKSLKGVKLHMMIHTGEKPFACNDCNKQFRQRIHLKNHFRSQHSELKKYKCEICEYTLSTRPALCMHMKSKHPK